MEKRGEVHMDKRYLRDVRISRFAKICCNAGLFCGIVLLLLGLLPAIRVIYYIFVGIIVLAVIVFWLISLIILHPFDISFINIESIWVSDEIFARVRAVTVKCTPYLCAIAVVLGVVALVLFIKGKAVNKKSRIVASSLAIGFAVVGTVVVFVGGIL